MPEALHTSILVIHFFILYKKKRNGGRALPVYDLAVGIIV